MTRGKHGFTLLEIAVAISIFGVLALVSYGVFARVLDAKQTVEARADEAAVARTTLARIVRDVRAATLRSPVSRALPGAVPGALPTPGAAAMPTPIASTAAPAFVSIDHSEASVPFDEMAFTAIVRRPLSLAATASDLATVHYFLRAQEDRRGRFVLYRESISTLSGQTIDLAKPDPTATTAIVDGVGGLRFRFFDGEEWVEEWSSIAGRRTGRMPLAVEIILALEGGDGAMETYHTAVDLPAALATGSTPQAVAGKAGKPGGKDDDEDDEDEPARRRASDDDDDDF